MSPSGLSRYRAERLLRKDFAGLRSKVLAVVRSQLRAKNVRLDPADLEACYSQAWHGLYATVLDGELVENPTAWLVLVTFRRAIDESRTATRVNGGPGAHASAIDLDGAGEWQGGASDPDLAGALDDRARLRQLFEGLRTRLSERECEAASLCYLQGLSRAEAAERMGISVARMGKLMEGSGAGRPGVASKVGGLLDTIKSGGWCEQQSSLMRAFAFGILDPAGERYSLALAHCRECPACRAYVASLRGLASVLPLPLLSPLALAGGASAGACTGGGSKSPATHAVNVGPSRVAGRVTRVAGRATRGAWSGLRGSLTAKLAATALVVTLGSGYAVLDNRTHESSRVTPVLALPSRATPSPLARRASAQALIPALGTQISRGPSTARRSHARGTTSRHGRAGVSSARNPVAHEFLPERVRELRPEAPATPLPTPRPTSSTHPSVTGEFGIE